jgi:hypothetical protein
LSNPATETAYQQVKQRIELLEKTPGDTVDQVQDHLRSQARKAGLKQGAKLALCGALAAGFFTLVAGGTNSVLPVLGAFACMGGAMGAGFWSIVDQVDREIALEGVKALDEETAPFGASGTGNLIGAPTVSLGGEATVGQLRSLLQATQTVLEAERLPEAAPARALLKKDLKRIKRLRDEPLTELRESIARREARLELWGRSSAWMVAGGMAVMALGSPPIGIGLMVAGIAALPAYEILGGARLVETLDRWEPQLEAFRSAYNDAEHVRDWTLEGTGPGVKEGERAVIIGGVAVKLRPVPAR